MQWKNCAHLKGNVLKDETKPEYNSDAAAVVGHEGHICYW